MTRPFTQAEDTLLRELHPTHTRNEVAQIMRRSNHSIRKRIKVLKLSPRPWGRSKETIERARATRYANKLQETIPTDYSTGWPKKTTTDAEALIGKVFGKPKPSHSQSNPISGNKFTRKGVEGSTGSAARMCVEG